MQKQEKIYKLIQERSQLILSKGKTSHQLNWVKCIRPICPTSRKR